MKVGIYMKKRTQNGYVKTRTQKSRDKAAASSKNMLHRTVCSAVAIVMLLGVLQTGVFAFGAVAQTSNEIIDSMTQNAPAPELSEEILSGLQSEPSPAAPEETVTGESTPSEPVQEHTVTLYVDGKQYLEPIQTVDGKIAEPQAPTEDVYPEGAGAFAGWFFEAEDGGKFNADSQIGADIKLYAQFDAPVPPEGNLLTEEPIEAPAEGALTATLYVNGQPYGEQILVEDGKISMPAPPATDVWPANSSFVGWYTQQEGGELFNPETEIAQSISLYARFNAENFLVTFEDQYGKTFDTLDAAPGQPYPQTQKIITPDEGQRFLYWVEKGTDVQFDFNAPAAKDVTLVPYFSNSYYVFFFSEGTQIDPVAVDAGSKVAAPAAPTRGGYQFTGWATEDGQPYNFDQPVNGTLRLYAQWQGQNVQYTVVYWTERANIAGTPSWPNDYISTKVATGTAVAGSQIANVGEVDLSNKPSDATLKFFDTAKPILAAPVAIQGNGQSVVNVCYNRIEYTMNFVLSNAQATLNGTVTWAGAVGGQGTYTNPTKDQVVYSFKAKYEQDISGLWPSMNVNMTLANSGAKQPYAWRTYTMREGGGGIGDTMVTKRVTLEPDLIPLTGGYDAWANGIIGSSIVWYPAYADNMQTFEINYWYEALIGEDGVDAEAGVSTPSTGPGVIGKKYVKDAALSQIVKTDKATGGFSAKDLEGMIKAGWTPESYVWANIDENGVAHYNFYYNRKALSLNYNTVGGSVIPGKSNVLFGEKISNVKPSDPTKTNAKFLGWYYDSAYKNPVDWTADTVKTSQSGGGSTITLFAKWESEENIVSFYDKQTSLAGGTPIATQGVATGGYVDLSMPITMEVNGKTYALTAGTEVPGYGEFIGWYWLIGGSEPAAFSADTPVNRSYSLYANWKTTGFKLTYDKGAATGGTLPSADGVYDIGTQVRVAQNTGSLVSGNLVFIGWLSDVDGKLYYENSKIAIQGNTVLTAQFGDPTNYSQITFVPGYSGSGQANVIAKAERNKETKLAAADTFTREGYDFVGWQLTGGGTYAAEGAYTPTTVTATFTALWKAQAHTVTFTTDGNGTLTGTTSYPDIADGTTWRSAQIGVPKPVANPGYYFYGWTPAIPGPDTAITADQTYTAVFKQQYQLAVSAASAEKTYDGQPLTKADVTDYTKSQLMSGDTIQVTMTASSTITNAGTQPNVIESIKIMRNGVDVTNEYQFGTPKAGELKINKMNVTLTVTDKDKTYGESDPSFGYTTDVTPGADFTVSINRETGENVKTDGTQYAVNATVSNPNYNVTVVPGKLTINPREITLTANSGAKSYGSDDPAVIYADPQITSGSFAPGESFDKVVDSITRAPGENVGNYAVNIGLKTNPNYNVTANPGNLEITPSTVTVSITPFDNSKTYGETDPALIATVGGLPEGTLVAGRDYELVRAEGDVVGTYAITVKLLGNTGTNYGTISLGEGTFTVNPRPVTLTANNGSKTYGQTDAQALPADWKGATLTVGNLIGTDSLNYSVSRTGAENAGTYAVVITLGNNPNYDVTTVDGTFVIHKKTIDVYANDAQKTYGDSDPSFSATASGLVGEDKLDFTFTREDGENVGDYAITVNTGNYDNYIINPIPGGKLTINPKDVTVTPNPSGKVYGYDDPALSANVIGTVNGESLVYGKDYTLSRTGDENVGDYKVIVGAGTDANPNYNIIKSENTFVISQRPITLQAEDKTKKFGEADPKLTYVVVEKDPDGLVEGDTLDITSITRADGSSVGQYKITIVPGSNPNYDVKTIDGWLTITPKDVDVTIQPKNTGKVYGEDDPVFDENDVTISGLPAGETLVYGVDYIVERAKAIVGDPVGPYNMYVKLLDREAGNYDYRIQTLTGTFTVAPRPITITVDDTRKTYGTAADPDFTAQVTEGSMYNGEVIELNYTREKAGQADGEKAGSYAIDASVKTNIFGQNEIAANYKIKFVAGTLTIDPRDITIQVNSDSKFYGDDDPTFSTSLPDETQLVQGDLIDLTLSRVEGENVIAGGYPINGVEAVKNPNYNVTILPGTLTINPREITVDAKDTGKTYGDPLDPELEVTVGNLPADKTLTPGVDYEIKREGGIDAGDYTITVTPLDNPNYVIKPGEGTFTIAKRSVDVYIDSTGKTYNDPADPDPQFSAVAGNPAIPGNYVVNGEKLAYELVREPGEGVGEYPITESADFDPLEGANKNYNITFHPGTFTIVPKGGIKIVPNPQFITYGDAEAPLTWTIIGDVTEEQLNFTLERTEPDNVNAGTYTISVKLGDNPDYTIDASATALYTINKKDASIIADPKVMTYGDTDIPALSAQASGMVNGETLGYDLSREDETNMNAGVYGIYVAFDENGPVNKNYNITPQNSTFTIKKRPAEIAVDGPHTKVYGEPDPALSATVTGTVNGEELTYGFTRAPGENVKPDGAGGYLPYALGATFDANEDANVNYDITVKTNTLTITPRTVKVTPNDTSKVYDGKGIESDPTFTVTIENLPADPALAPKAGEDFTLSREDEADVKYDENGNVTSYPITVTPGSNPNFVIETGEGAFTITKRDATITVENDGKLFKGPEPIEFKSGVSGTVNGDVLIYTVGRVAGEDVNTDPGYPINADFDPMNGVNKNYKIDVVPGTFTIAPSDVELMVIPDNKTIIYGDAPLALSAKVIGPDGEVDGINYTLEREQNNNNNVRRDADGNVISYEIKVVLGSNPGYSNIDATATASYTINPKDASVTAIDNGKVYGDADPELKATVEGTVGNETLNYTLARDGANTPEGENVKAGGYPINVTLGNNPNYTVSEYGATFTITKRPAEIRAIGQTITYGETPKPFEANVSGVLKNETLNYDLRTDSDGNAGKHNIFVVDYANNPNYDVTVVDNLLIINKKQITVTPDNGGKTYGDPDPDQLTGKVEGAVEGGSTPNFDIVRQPGNDAGDYTITVVPGDNPNYEIIPGEGIFTIAQKEAIIYVDNKGKVYGDADPTFTAKTEGVKAGDSLNYTLGRTSGENAGNYPITAALGENKNYKVTVIDGTLTIAPRDVNVIITPNNATKVYGTAEAPLTAQVSGTVNGDGLNYTLSREAGENVGSYTINVNLGSNPNYKVAVGKGTYVITPATVTITVGNYTKTAGTGDPGFGATVTGLVNGDALDYALNREAGEAVGSYAINAQLNGENPNYNVVVVPGALNITAAPAPAAPAPATPATPAAPAAPAAPAGTTNQPTTIGENDTPQGGANPEAIGDQKIPLASVEASWALLNLILAIVTGLISLMLVITYFVKKRRDDEEDTERATMTRAEAKAEKEDEETHVKRKGLGRILSLVVTIIAVVVFILTENMSLPMVWTDEWTLLMGIIAIVNVVLAFLCRKEKKGNDEQQNKQLPDDAQPQNL